MTKRVVHRFPDANAVAESVAAKILEKLESLLKTKNEVHLVLTGGSVGIQTLASMNSNQKLNDVDFTKVHLWWGDERFVSAQSSDRNSLQAKNALLKYLKLDPNKVHEFPASDQGLSLSEAEVYFAGQVSSISPKFDLVLLGMGPDGHIASLFPGKSVGDSSHSVVAEHDSPKPPPLRLSFNFATINDSKEIWFTVAGADKAVAVATVFGDEPEKLPAGRISGKEKTVWYVDQTAGNLVWGC